MCRPAVERQLLPAYPANPPADRRRRRDRLRPPKEPHRHADAVRAYDLGIPTAEAFIRQYYTSLPQGIGPPATEQPAPPTVSMEERQRRIADELAAQLTCPRGGDRRPRQGHAGLPAAGEAGTGTTSLMM